MRGRTSLVPGLALIAASLASGAEPTSGWRGGGPGLYPNATTPTEWYRLPRGAMDGLHCVATRPKGTEAGDSPVVEKGLLRDWLIIGPFAVEDSVRDFDRDFLGGETAVEPVAGQKIGERTWTAATVPPDDIMVFGTAEMPWLDLAKAVGFQRNQLAYAHCYLFSPRGGRARIVVDHGHGLKAWVNGKPVYRSPGRRVALGFYTAISRHELQHLDQPSPHFELELKPGWNRLLLKLSTSNRVDFTDMRCSLRIMDPPDVAYETKNIRWMAPLPGRSTSTPIIVGDRIFVMAEPDELLCLDKRSGRRLWSAAINYYEALTTEERQAKPAYAANIDPLLAKLRDETDRTKRIRLRAEIQKALIAIDPARFSISANDHFEAHFGIVGFTMPTPVSDGTHVYVWSGLGLAACFDLDGKRQWITRVETEHLTYGSSPALAGGMLVVYLNQLFGLDAKTGKLLWQQKKIRNNVASLLAMTVAGQPIVITQRGDVVRPSDGELLYRPRDSNAPGDTGWAPPVILGSRMYLPKHGVSSVTEFDFADATPGHWEPKAAAKIQLPETISRGPDGKWLDRWTAGSPLVWDGIVYACDIYQTLYAAELKSGKMLYRREMELKGFMHYNSVPVAASPTLVGRHVVLLDNQGTAVLVTPGAEPKVVARNRIATQLDRSWPIPSQETLSYAPPVVEGDRLYLRGEAFLYCIGTRGP